MQDDQAKTESPAAVRSTPLVGRPWRVVINGKKTLNGRRYGATFTGTVKKTYGEQTAYELLRALADHLEQNNAEMEYPDSFQVTFPPNEKAQ